VFTAVALAFGISLVTAQGVGATPSAATTAAPSRQELSQIKQRYSLVGTISYSSATVRGTATISLTNNSAGSFSELYFQFAPRYLPHRADLPGFNSSVGQVEVDGTPARYSWPRSAMLLLDLGGTVAPGATTSIRIPFTVRVGTITGGRYGAWGARLNKHNGIATFGNWFPILTTDHAMSTIGDPFITWNAASIHLDLTLGDAAHSSLPGSAVAAGGKRTAVSGTHWTFHANNVRDLAFAISPSFVSCRATMANHARTVLRAYAKSTSRCADFVSIGRQAFNKLSTTWGPYPYSTLSIIQSAGEDFSMEYPTSVFIGHGVGVAKHTWHELAHQWFYGLLGNDQVAEPWIDESWAEYSSTYLRNGVLQTACGGADVNRSIYSFSDWSGCGQYGQTIYRRGARFVNRLRAEFGSDGAFYRAVRDYIALRRYRLVGGRNLLEYLDSRTTADLFSSGVVCGYTSYC
jgi:hypothetical protein